jgi:hypothetical protein
VTTDKRSVSTDALDTLGTVELPEGSGRDAIHLAVEPVIAGDRLLPGERITLKGGVAVSTSYTRLKTLGIVDPFLRDPVEKGQSFWLVVLPRQITSLHHVWSHPDFPEAPQIDATKAKVKEALREDAEEWLRDFAERNDMDYDELVAAATDSHEGAYLCVGSNEPNNRTIPPEFWGHFRNLTGIEVGEDRPEYFTCSC